MIEKLSAVKIISAVVNLNISGNAYSFGDQIPTFSKKYANELIRRLSQGLPPSQEEDDDPPMSASEFFSLCGFSSYTDIDYNGKAKLSLDLGKPIPEELFGAADLLYDGGVIEHIPNCFQAMSNAVLLLKKGGVLIEGVPTACFGESYYNIDPLLLRDFYGSNGMEMLDCGLYYNKGDILSRLSSIIKSGIRSYVPQQVISFYQYKKNQKKIFTKIRGSFDNMHKLGVLNPFDPKDISRINFQGMPPRTHVFYVGIKRMDVSPENIVSPTQENYPTMVNR